MRDQKIGTKTETRALGLVALVCYSTTLVALLTCCYSLLAVLSSTVGRDFAGLLYPATL